MGGNFQRGVIVQREIFRGSSGVVSSGELLRGNCPGVIVLGAMS